VHFQAVLLIIAKDAMWTEHVVAQSLYIVISLLLLKRFGGRFPLT
jgi:hypothetical protein